MLFNGPDNSPSPLGIWHDSLGPNVIPPNGTSISSVVSAWLTNVTNKQTNRQTTLLRLLQSAASSDCCNATYNGRESGPDNISPELLECAASSSGGLAALPSDWRDPAL